MKFILMVTSTTVSLISQVPLSQLKREQHTFQNMHETMNWTVITSDYHYMQWNIVFFFRNNCPFLQKKCLFLQKKCLFLFFLNMHFSLEKETNFIRNCMLQKLNVCSSQLYAPFWIFSKYAPANLAILPKCMLQMEHTQTLWERKIDATQHQIGMQYAQGRL